MGLFITIIFILLETALFIFSIGDIGISVEASLFPAYKEVIAVAVSVVNLLIVCLMLAISISSIKRIKKKQKTMLRQIFYLIGLSIIWLANIAINAVCVNYAEGDSSVFIGAFVMIAAGLMIVLPTFFISDNKDFRIQKDKINFRKQKGEEIRAALMEKTYYTGENAEWHDDAGLHMGYLLTWLASRNLLSFELNETFNYPLEAEDVTAHRRNGLELLESMDFKIWAHDIGAGESREAFKYKPGYRRTFEMDKKDGFIHKFLGCYINGMAPFHSDFYKDIQSIIMKDRVQYSQKFSWDTYEKIAALLDQKYDYFVYYEEQFHIEESFEYPEQESETSNMTVYTIENERWWLDFQVYTRPDVKEEYRDRVIQLIKDMSLSLQKEIGRKLLEIYYDDYVSDFISDMPENKQIKRTADHKNIADNMEPIGEVMKKISDNPEELFMYDELFGCLQLHIYAPRDEAIIAYVIAGDSLLEEEHGISISIFDDHVLEVGYGYDFENPWIV